MLQTDLYLSRLGSATLLLLGRRSAYGVPAQDQRSDVVRPTDATYRSSPTATPCPLPKSPNGTDLISTRTKGVYEECVAVQVMSTRRCPHSLTLRCCCGQSPGPWRRVGFYPVLADR